MAKKFGRSALLVATMSMALADVALAQSNGVQTDIFQGGRGAQIPGVTVPHEAPQPQIQQQQQPAPQRKAAPKKAAAAKPAGKAAIPVTYDKKLSAEIQDQFLQRVKAESPDSVDEVRKQLEQRSAEDRFADDLRTYGFSINDMSDVAAAHMLLMWMIANKVDAPPSDAAQAVRSQIRKSLLQDPALGKASARDRQLKAERIIYDALTRISAFNQLRRAGDDAKLQQFSDQTREDFQKTQQIDLRTLRLTSQGFAQAKQG